MNLLASRGLVVADSAEAARFLSHVNYFRFSGYCLAFEVKRHEFIPGTTFESVRDAYGFDILLRARVIEAVEAVEVDFRTAIAHHFGERHGPFGHTQAATFDMHFPHPDWLQRLHQEATRSSELFVTHFDRYYREFPNLPIWVATETMSFGALSQMFGGMKRADQRAIAPRYGVQPFFLQSWMHHLSYIRNLCAHHSRLWDRIWSIQPNPLAGKSWLPPLLNGSNRLHVTLLILYTMLRKCPAKQTDADYWRDGIEELLSDPPPAPKAAERMGLSHDWKNHPCWRPDT